MRRGFLSAITLLALLGLGPAHAVDSYTVATTATTTITEHTVCRQVTNNHASGETIMVPTKTANEWSTGGNAFINALPSGVTAVACPTGASLRFRSANNAYLSRTPSSAGTRTQYTFSSWIKLGAAAASTSEYGLLGQWSGVNGAFGNRIVVKNNQIVVTIDDYTGSGAGSAVTYTAAPLLRDPSAWYHVVAVFDTTLATRTERVKVYINGAEQSVSMSTVYGPYAQNYTLALGNTSYPMYVGARSNSSSSAAAARFDGYMAHVNLVQGSALTPSSFGELDANNHWVPKDYAGSYGTNGFYLDFADNTSTTTLGQDAAGSNDWTLNNFSLSGVTNDSVLDAPDLTASQGNFATLNPLSKSISGIPVTNGNLSTSNSASGGNWYGLGSTMSVSSGKWYYEFAYTGANSVASGFVGFAEDDISIDSNVSDSFSEVFGWYLRNDSGGTGEGFRNFDAGGGSFNGGVDAPASGTVMLALDLDNNRGWVGRDGTWFGSGNPAGGTNPTGTFTAGKALMPFVMPASGSAATINYDFDFGQRGFTYTPPSGFKALHTGNFPDPTIKDPSPYFKIATYTGNGTYQSVGEPAKFAGSMNISKSLRFDSGSNAYLSRTFSSGDRKTWTWSAWVKRSKMGTSQVLLNSFGPGGFGIEASLAVTTGDGLDFIFDYNGGSRYRLVTTQVFRDPSAWHHLVLTADTANATSSDRLRLYVDGTRVTSFSTENYPALNANGTMNQGYGHRMGSYNGSLSFFDGYMADVNFVDGQALDATSFGEFDANGNWVPKNYAGAYGTNGFELDFADNSSVSALGNDASSNSNNWTVNNISVTAGSGNDSLRDTPTPFSDGGGERGNYSVLSPIAVNTNPTYGGVGNIIGGLELSSVGSTNNAYSTFTIPDQGKYYVEVRTSSLNTAYLGLMAADGNVNRSVLFDHTGVIKWNNATTQSGLGGWTSGDTIGMAIDADADTIQFYRQNVIQGTAEPISTNYVQPYYIFGRANAYLEWNFGQRPFTYTPPSGFKALSTYNLNNASFTPDLVITKNRSSAQSWAWYDRLRGATLELSSNSTAVQSAQSTGLLSFQNGGFTAGSSAKMNTSGQNYVSYMFKEGTTPGFDVVTYTGTGSAQNINHDLGVTPSLIIAKGTSGTTRSWRVQHKDVVATKLLYLETGNAATVDNDFNNSYGTSSVFSVADTLSENATQYVAYLFAEVEGFSKFGSYVGNGSADGPFVNLGFKPAFVLIKDVDAGSRNWFVYDAGRSSSNVVAAGLKASTSDAETTIVSVDFLSNGFKIRHNSSGSSINDSAHTIIYAAFAENPFKHANAR